MNCRTYDFSSFSHGNGPQSGSGRAANSSCGLSTSFLDVGQDTELFGRPTPAFLAMNQQIGYSPTAYMHNIAALNECCKTLDMQLFKVTAERDVLKATLDQLASSLGSSNPTPPGSIKAEETYPKAHSNPRWKVAFREDEEGNTVSRDVIKAIHKKIRGTWAELVKKDTAPKTWGKAAVSAKDFVYTHVYKAFPFLQLAESNWKLDSLCGNDYPGWYRNNGQGKLPGNQEVKDEDNTEDDELGMGTRKKQRAERCKPEVVEKRMKVGSDSDSQSPPLTTSCSPSKSPLPESPSGNQLPSGSLPPLSATVPMSSTCILPSSSPTSAHHSDSESPVLNTTPPHENAMEVSCSAATVPSSSTA
ncbi:hypothetical protein PAXRUDRAFT_19539 [Paxillus rubicundulus Ve08.2h10]|uniref:Uncharacterized protein n=1 Tax=Paxillus rubicundulus Ve08.2h10 TaxID=930991 RepID=A0A0D0DC10_9AGAM|nr:hypothetical protein PAXRUDRAFT_19539 [Paxillus rubicundulus Ve08.2h10]